jgi:hypothetical protein
VSASQEQAVKIVQRAIPNLEVGSVTLGKQGEWKVDLTYKKAVVADMSVHGGDGSILPDLKASQDASPGFTPGPPVPPPPGAYPPPPPPSL